MKLLRVGGMILFVLGLALLAAWLAQWGERPAHLVWQEPEVKGALMTLGYKVYGNPKLEFGRHYLSKIVFKNEGEHPLTDFTVSYKVGDYIAWTDAEQAQSIPAGLTFVKTYYPKLPAEVSKLRNATTTTWQARVRWKEEGRPKEQVFNRDVLLRGINELASSDLPERELQTWFDNENAANFAMALVTPNDPVVNLYTAEITRLAGGTTAGIAGGPQEVIRLCRITYDYMLATGLRYTGDSWSLANYDNVKTVLQTVRLPRDVIINNQGLCIELTLLWCALLEHMGVQSAMVLIPGHAFVVAYSEEQGMPLAKGLPIECTAITPRAVDPKRTMTVPFEEAVKMAAETMQLSQKDGRIMLLEARKIQAMGYTPPELPDLDISRLGETLAKRLPAVVAPPRLQPPPLRPPLQPPPLVPPPLPPPVNGWSWQDPAGLVAATIPSGFTQGPVMFPFTVFAASNAVVGIEVHQIGAAQDPDQALAYLGAAFAQNGSRLQISGRAPHSSGATAFNGQTMSLQGVVNWSCLAKATPRGVVVAAAGCAADQWALQQSTIQAVLSSVRFK